jgi:hypothetical protein
MRIEGLSALALTLFLTPLLPTPSAGAAADCEGAACAPGKDGYLTLKSIVGTYRADYSEPRCGAPGATA